jgi:hypothetical protein
MSLHSIALPYERYFQLKNLADALGQSLTDTIGTFIKQAINAGQIPADIPGWTVEREGEQIHFANAETGLAWRWSLAAAQDVADSLKELSDPDPDFKRGAHLNADAGWIQIDRKGRGIRIIDSERKITCPVSLGIAQDLAGLIRKAAA